MYWTYGKTNEFEKWQLVTREHNLVRVLVTLVRMENTPIRAYYLDGSMADFPTPALANHAMQEKFGCEPLPTFSDKELGLSPKYVKCDICGQTWDTISPCAPCNATRSGGWAV